MNKLSIITICYNEPNLEKTCQSIVNQTWQDFEWVVIDGGSNKETLDIFEKYKYRINKFISEPDNGIYNACNKGIKIAEGEYLIFMNAGDTFYDNEVLKLFNCFIEKNKADVYYGNCECSLMQENNIGDFVSNYPKELTKEFFINSNICTQGTFILKSLFDKYGLFNENYKVVADFEKWLQFFNDGVIFKRIPVIVAVYDLNGISSNKKNRKLVSTERESLFRRYYTKSEIIAEEKKYKKAKTKQEFSFLERIFSIKNSTGKTHKIITILGLSFRIKR